MSDDVKPKARAQRRISAGTGRELPKLRRARTADVAKNVSPTNGSCLRLSAVAYQ
jgi:hypothetical protein